MTSLKQQTKASEMLRLIRENSPINKYDLMDMARMSVNQYNAIAGWFRYRYEETNQQVEYDKQNKTWIWRGKLA